ncbi:MAG: CPBP family intramembrane glutamic endopeptidase [Candidatus Helarchaeota archaeon]
MKIKDELRKKRVNILISTIILTVAYYLMALLYVRVSIDRKNIVFFHWVFGNLFGGSIWIDFWQYIFQFVLSLILFFIVPVIIIKYYFKEDLKEYGIQKGKIKFNLIFTIVGACLLPLFLFISNNPELLNEYPLTKLVLGDMGLFITFNLVYILYYIGYEFIFRAYLQFGLEKNKTKKEILVILTIQTLITTLFHIGKPLTELIAAAAVGPIFGYLTLKGRSFIWPVLVFHIGIGIIGNIAPLIW